MNWYESENCQEDITHFIKTASYDWKNQDAYFDDELNEVQRYKLDPYAVSIVKSITAKKLTANICIKHASLGPVIWAHYLVFNKDEDDKCNKIVKKWSEVVQGIMKDFVTNETPTSIFVPSVRRAIVEMGDRGYITKTNIPHINFSYDLLPEADWRSTIYGTRYPEYKEESFDQHYGGRVGRQT